MKAATSPEEALADDAIVLEGISKLFRPRRRGFRLAISRLDDDDANDDEDNVDEEPAEKRPTIATDTWALHDVSLRVAPGTTTVILGGTASGKSTLLRILSGVTRPSTGRGILRGRVAPTPDTAGVLLQPDLTVRDNVLLLARFLSVPRAVALERVDEIVDFAELRRQEDLPLRHYASRLRPRLAFATTLAFDPDILLADGRVGVGDTEYRTHCLRRVRRLQAQRGTTLVVATDAPRYAAAIADQVLWLEAGRVRAWGAASEVIGRYDEAAASSA